MTEETINPAAKVQRTSAGLRDALFDELDSLRAGDSNSSKANATAKLADQIVNVVKMEMEVQKHAERHANHIDDSGTTRTVLGPTVSLGA